MRYWAAHRLEATLGVIDPLQGDTLDDPVKDPPHHMAVPRFALTAGPQPLARTDYHIVPNP